GGPDEGVDNSVPLSYSQRSLWYFHRLVSAGPVYNIPVVVRLRGQVDAEALRRAADHVVGRHETLRTTFREIGGEPRAVVSPTARCDFGTVDVSSEPVPEQAAARAVSSEASRPIDLTEGPLLRLRLIRLAPEEHHLCVVVHHIVADAWSTNV